MDEKTILNTGRTFFWTSFILGNICLFGYIFTKNDSFVAGGYLLLIFGTIINLLAILILMIYGIINKPKLKNCMKASMIICINIPIAIIFFYIGISLLNL